MGVRLRVADASRRALVVGIAVIATLHFGGAPAQATPGEIATDGPLTAIRTTPDLGCDVRHQDDAQGEFFGNTACATLVAVGGTLFGPAVIPAGSAASPRTAFANLSQTEPAGAGTAADPVSVVTRASGGEAVEVEQADSYVVGNEFYRTDVTVKNLAAEPQTITVYRAGDCFLQDSDAGFGRLDTGPAGAAPTCQGVLLDSDGEPVVVNGSYQRGPRIEQWIPITAGSRYMEGNYQQVWSAIGTQNPLPNTCACADEEFTDNGAGLSWTVQVPAGGTATVSHLTAFSPAGDTPIDDCGEDGLQAILDNGLASGAIHDTVEPVLETRAPTVAGALHDSDCTHVVPWEDHVDWMLGEWKQVAETSVTAWRNQFAPVLADAENRLPLSPPAPPAPVVPLP